MLNSGQFGKVQHMRGVHYQPMDAGYWNTETSHYWQGLPPMHYSTHAIAPLHGIAGSRIDKVVCFGSGTMAPHLQEHYQNPYPIEDALLSFENGLKGQVVRGLFECSAYPTESFTIYGSQKTFTTEYFPRIITKTVDLNSYDHAGFRVEEYRHQNFYQSLPQELHRPD